MNAIKQTVTTAAKNFSGALGRFYPAFGGNGFNERNLSSQLGRAFCSCQGRHVFYEVPFRQKGSKTTCHFDAVLYSKQSCVIVESKRLYHNAKNNEIISDIGRIKDNHKSIRQMFTSSAPKHFFGLVIAESWENIGKPSSSGDVADWWVHGTGKEKWTQDGYPTNWHYASMAVHRFDEQENGSQHELRWLYAYGKL